MGMLVAPVAGCVWGSRGRRITTQGQMLSTGAKLTTFLSHFPEQVWGPKSLLTVSVSYCCKQNPIALFTTTRIYHCCRSVDGSSDVGWARLVLDGHTHASVVNWLFWDDLGRKNWPKWELFPCVSHISPAASGF